MEKRRFLPFFPAPYPDECLYSIVARYHVRSANPHFRMTLIDLFPSSKSGPTSIGSTITMPSHLTTTDHWADPKVGLTTDYIAKKHTAIQFYATRACLKPADINAWVWKNHAW